MTAPRRSERLFQLTAAFAGVFVLTVLALIAGTFGDPNSPANLWFNRHATWLLLAEVALIAVTGCAAMAADQRARRRAEVEPEHNTRQESPRS